MKLRLLLGLVAALAVLLPGGSAVGSLPPGEPTVGLDRLNETSSPLSVVRGIATFDATPTAFDVAALQAHGLTVQPMKHLPLALVRGTVQSMSAAVAGGAANDVYPDERIQLLDQASADAMGSAIPRANGFTGKGVTVAVVDSGCDASHPDLADHVTHNVKLYSAEYVNIPPDSSNTIVVPIERGPYQNTDLGSGHGTHVAGIIAADGHASDVYPDEPIELLDTTSADAMGAAIPRSKGLTGKGVTVAVVDSGCDASHPDLADHVAHNVKLYSGEYAQHPT